MTLIYGASASNGDKTCHAYIRRHSCHDELWWHGIYASYHYVPSREMGINSQYKRKRHRLVSCIIVHIERKASNDCGSYGAADNVNINATIAH